MTVEIKRLSIKTSFSTPPQAQVETPHAAPAPNRSQDDLLKACERLVREILNEERER